MIILTGAWGVQLLIARRVGGLLIMVWYSRYNLISLLIVFEIGTLLTLAALVLSSNIVDFSLTFFIYLICRVCEACVGVSLLVSFTRRAGNSHLSP